MRGKDSYERSCTCHIGITPAYAGKSRSQPRLPCTGRDHPRVCGEKLSVCMALKYPVGSPPRMRGKGVSLSGHISVKRITPACAGKSRCPLGHHPRLRDHPRVCGEKISLVFSMALCWGSPPRMRGKEGLVALRLAVVGITPACAGKRSQGFAVRLSTRDYPRLCGEKLLFTSATTSAVGSPPRVRGKVRQLAITVDFLRITPACAGKRADGAGGRAALGDHPRVCGEKNAPGQA